jgi:hypothetical protein
MPHMQVLNSKDPSSCLEYFAKVQPALLQLAPVLWHGPQAQACLPAPRSQAVEIDELGCGWKAQFESKMEKIGRTC